jgi:RHS repeat-associated protein
LAKGWDVLSERSGIDDKLKTKTGTTSQFYLQNHLGSTVALTNSSGAITESQSYDSFGNRTNTTFSNRYQFTGREYDATTGLQYSRARWYDPQLGRFISEDPIGFGGGDVNRYVYVGNGTLSKIDPMGLQASGGGIQFLPPGSIGLDSYEKIRKAFEDMKNSCECRKAFEGFGINLDDVANHGILVGSSDTILNSKYGDDVLGLSGIERGNATPHVGSAKGFTVTTTEADSRPKIFLGPDSYSDRWTPFSDPNRAFRRAFAHELMHAGGIPGKPIWWPFTDDLSYLNGWWKKPYSDLIDKCGM